jgi:L-aspartate oxidase
MKGGSERMDETVMPVALVDGPGAMRYLAGRDLRVTPLLEADVIVVGSGVAGLAAALAAAEQGAEVLLVAKGMLEESNTRYAQGGIAGVGADALAAGDTIEQHVSDTLVAGGGMCHEPAVASILADAGPVLDDLLQGGTQFDLSATSDDQRLALTREGGHSARRILHANGDATGAEIARSLLARCRRNERILIRQNCFAIDLLDDQHGRICGVLVDRKTTKLALYGKAVILATGGSGQVFRETTNPAVATGDGLAMAYRAGAQVADCEFVQFHPTTLYIAGGARRLISEAMRGEGAQIKNQAGERFLQGIHPDAELAPRDVVAQAIVEEIAQSGFPHVWLDATHLGGEFVKRRFPTIFAACNEFGIDPGQEWIPVHPSAHYHCGGILTDASGRTSLPGLYAAGEVGCTGLNGANRLASNSLLEGLIVGRRAGALAAGDAAPAGRPQRYLNAAPAAPESLDVRDLAQSLRSLMWRQVGIRRDGPAVEQARRTLRFWRRHQARGQLFTPEGWALQNRLLVGSLIARGAAARECSVGTHWRSDGPSCATEPLIHYAMQRPDEEI